jgi:hypothetical protein
VKVRTETDPVTEMSSFLEYRMMEKVQKNSVNSVKMDLRETGWGAMYWIHLAQDRDQWRALVNMVMNLRVP